MQRRRRQRRLPPRARAPVPGRARRLRGRRAVADRPRRRGVRHRPAARSAASRRAPTSPLLTLIRLRDRLGGTPPFLGADLCYGVYDFSGTPSTQQLGKVPYATGDGANRRRTTSATARPTRRRDPAISPLWAELHDLPPMPAHRRHRRLAARRLAVLRRPARAAGSPVELAVYPEGPHGIDSAPTAMGRAAANRIHDFLRDCLA